MTMGVLAVRISLSNPFLPLRPLPFNLLSICVFDLHVLLSRVQELLCGSLVDTKSDDDRSGMSDLGVIKRSYRHIQSNPYHQPIILK